MPCLDHENSLQFWQHFMGGAVYDIIDFLEKNESWTISSNSDVEVALSKLGNQLEIATSNVDFDETTLVHVCSLVSMSQKLRIMQCLDSIKPGMATRVISTAEFLADKDTLAKIFLERNMKFERIRILQRVFSPKRIQQVQKLYEK